MLFNVFHSHMLALISCLFAIEEQHESPHRRGGDICLGGLSPPIIGTGLPHGQRDVGRMPRDGSNGRLP